MTRFLIAIVIVLLGFPLDSNAQYEFNRKKGTLYIHEVEFPDAINPIVSQNANARFMESLVFQRLVARNPLTQKLEGELAVGPPQITAIDQGEFSGGMSLTYQIRKEAMWDNGSPILASDYAFTIKAIKNIHVKAANLRVPFIGIRKLEIDPKNPRKFTIYSPDRNIWLAEIFGTWVLPQYHYDPEGYTNNYTVDYLSDPANEKDWGSNQDMVRFAGQFNSSKYSHLVGGIKGSGAYELIELNKDFWSGPIVLKRKSGWWGKKNEGYFFTAKPKYINYRVYDWHTALARFKKGELDVLRGINPQSYLELKKGDKMGTTFLSGQRYNFEFLAFNGFDPKLDNEHFRKAFNFLIDREYVYQAVLQGTGKLMDGPVLPIKPYYIPADKKYELDLEAARFHLDQSGWIDSDADGLRDKMIGGEKVDCRIFLDINEENPIREAIANSIKASAARVGVNVNIRIRRWNQVLQSIRYSTFEMVLMAYATDVDLDNFAGLWHSSARSGVGFNLTGFGDPYSDQLIMDIGSTFDEAVRSGMYKEFQTYLRDVCPAIFLYSPQNGIAMSKYVRNPHTLNNRMGLDPRLLEVK